MRRLSFITLQGDEVVFVRLSSGGYKSTASFADFWGAEGANVDWEGDKSKAGMVQDDGLLLLYVHCHLDHRLHYGLRPWQGAWQGWSSSLTFINTITGPGILSNKCLRGGMESTPLCFSGTIRPIILKFGMLMARTILMDSPLVPEQNIRNFRKNSGINIFPEFSGKFRIF